MADDHDNIVEFKQPKKPADAKATAKEELLNRIATGSQLIHKRILQEHIVYYASISVYLVVLIVLYLYNQFGG